MVRRTGYPYNYRTETYRNNRNETGRTGMRMAESKGFFGSVSGPKPDDARSKFNRLRRICTGMRTETPSILVGAAGFEPAISRSQTARFTRLSHTPPHIGAAHA